MEFERKYVLTYGLAFVLGGVAVILLLSSVFDPCSTDLSLGILSGPTKFTWCSSPEIPPRCDDYGISIVQKDYAYEGKDNVKSVQIDGTFTKPPPNDSLVLMGVGSDKGYWTHDTIRFVSAEKTWQGESYADRKMKAVIVALLGEQGRKLINYQLAVAEDAVDKEVGYVGIDDLTDDIEECDRTIVDWPND